MIPKYGNSEQALSFDKNVTTNEWMKELWTTAWMNETV